MTKRYTSAGLEKMSAAERADVIKDAVVTDPDQVDQELLARGWRTGSPILPAE